MKPAYNSTFLVSCVGAYQDSGLGTGGLVCIHENQAIIVDRMDCTGLYQTQDGRVYRFIRALQSIVGYTEQGFHFSIKLPGVKDAHDILLQGNSIVCVSTGSNEILWFDCFGHLLKRWQAEGEGDAWHLNCLWTVGDRIYVSAFGEFKANRGWSGATTESGFILDLYSGEKVLEGLSGPHNPRYFDNQWIVCDSLKNAVVIQDDTGNLKKIQLNGFTRGFACDSHYFYIGESANRNIADDEAHSSICVLDRHTFELIDRIMVPFPEIYDIVLAPITLYHNLVEHPDAFQLGFQTARIAALENQVDRGLEEYRKLQIKFQKHVQKKSMPFDLVSRVRRKLSFSRNC